MIFVSVVTLADYYIQSDQYRFGTEVYGFFYSSRELYIGSALLIILLSSAVVVFRRSMLGLVSFVFAFTLYVLVVTL